MTRTVAPNPNGLLVNATAARTILGVSAYRFRKLRDRGIVRPTIAYSRAYSRAQILEAKAELAVELVSRPDLAADTDHRAW
jgi:hypothetical protein